MKKLLYVILAAVIVTTAFARSTKTDMARQIAVFTEIYKELQTNYVDTLDALKTMRTAIDALLGQTDPYTEYYSADEQDRITSVSSGEYAGIGSYIMKRDSDIVLSEPQWDSPARRVGVRHGDILLMIGTDTVTPAFTTEMASSRLKGQPGTRVHIRVRRPWLPAGQDSILEFDITRGTITIDPVPYYGTVAPGIGYIDVSTFSEKTAGAFRDALRTLLNGEEPLKGLIIDLRQNGGGLLESAVQIASNFVPKGTEIVSVRGRDKRQTKTYKTTQAPIAPKLPLVVLVDDGTASAAEILSGSLQDLDRAVIMGRRSFGKGLVQTVRPVSYNGIIKVTTGRYYIPSGRLIQAIDYSHRNPDGSPARIPDSLTNIYHTRAGRIVRDGGGITPDVKVDLPDGNRLLYNVVSDLWAFDFANRYANRTSSIPSAEQFEITDTVFADFKRFIDPARFKYDRATETGIKYLRDAAKNEGYMNDSVAAQFDRLETLLHHDLDRDLDYNRAELEHILDNAIAERFYSNAEVIRRQLRYDNVLDSATHLLADPRNHATYLIAPPASKAK